MADTIRLLAALQTLLADNGTGAISAQDVRDFLVSAIPTGRSATAVVAASGATDKQKADADYVCDGTADNVEINAALTAVGANGRVVLTDGQFNLAARISMAQSGQVLEGQGRWATKLYLSNGANDCMIVIAGAASTRGQMVRGMNLDGNGANQTDGATVEARTALYIFGTGALSVTEPVLQDLYITGARGMGISCDGATGAHIIRPRMIDVITIQNGVPGVSGGGAFDGDGIHLGYCDDAVLLGINSQYNTDTGIACDFGSNIHIVAPICRANTSNQIALARGTTGAFLFGPVCDGLNLGNYGLRTGQFGDAGAGITDTVHVYGGRVMNNVIAGLLLENNGLFRMEVTDFDNTTNVSLGSSPGVLVARACPGITTEKGGTNTIPSGSTFVTFNHGLSFTPQTKQVMITPTNSPTNDPGNLYVFGVSATQITVACRSNPGAGGATFAWAVREDL